MSMNRIAAHLAVAWHTANEAILAYGEELLLADSTRFEGVRVIGVDEHVWSLSIFLCMGVRGRG